MANGNNVTVGGDLARRTFKSRIDPQDPMPWQREGFRHPDLIRWVQEARGEILAAVFTVARAWIQAGRPAPDRVPRVGSFEAWRDMIGGILEHAGVPDFLGNANEVYLQADEDRTQWENFLEALWGRYGSEPFTPGAVAALLTYPEGAAILDALPDNMAEAYHTKNKTFSLVLGHAFKRIDGRHYPGGWCIRQGKVSRGIRNWAITYAPREVPQKQGVVECGGMCDAGALSPDCLKREPPTVPALQGGDGGMSPIPYAQEKNTSIKQSPDTVITGSISKCAIALRDIPPSPPQPATEPTKEPDSKSGDGEERTTLHPHSTTALSPMPAGCLKHSIDRYEPRKYDSSIVCMVPGCKRPAAYGCGAGFPLCEGHYLAEVERVRRDGGRPA